MAEKTITATTTESYVEFNATYQFMWFRNFGENDCYISTHSGIVAGADDVTLLKAGEVARLTLPQAPAQSKAYIKAVDGSNTVEVHAQNFSDCPFRNKAKGGGQSISVEPLTVNDNGVYTAPTGKAYTPVTVDVQEEPWQPLQDGYSNFWFELTNDTLSPWLNFSAKTKNAVIDWGDGSGEQALTTLTPTHTYSKAGKYVVKCKGVTGIAVQQLYAPYDARYFTTLKYIELNSDVSSIGSTAFRYYCGIKKVVTSSNLTTIGYNAFINCSSLSYINLASSITTLQQGIFSSCFSLKNIILPSSLTTISATVFNVCSGLSDITIPELVTSIGNNAFNGCYSLSEIHCKPTTPPSLGAGVFANLPANFIIYVPTGTAETYKAASGWSTYADHILEEGQTPNRAMLAKFSVKTDEPQDDMR